MKFKNFIWDIIKMLFPNTCLGCEEIIPEGEFFCDYCFEMLERCNLEKLCLKCGQEKKNCQCDTRVFSFDGIVAPFYNVGCAQNAMYTMKFGKRKSIADLFAKQMALAVKYTFYDTKFDGICYVPLSIKSLRKRGFNQSREIAAIISKILDIPLIENQLMCCDKKKPQHKVNLDERFKNVKGVYVNCMDIKGKILLVDDIKTTGATLDECSKKLLSGGADAVYCTVGLITKRSVKSLKKG